MTARDQPRKPPPWRRSQARTAPVRLPAIRVRTEPTRSRLFLRETGGVGTGDFVPLTFPFRWLALPAIRAQILQLIGGDGFLPVHEAQSFAYEQSLRIDTDYVLAVEIEDRRKAAAPDSENGGFDRGRGRFAPDLETILRIVRLTAERPS